MNEKNKKVKFDDDVEKFARLIKSIPKENQVRTLDIATGAVIQLTKKPIDKEYKQT